MASTSPSSQRRHTTYFDEEGEGILRSKGSSVTVEWSDGSKVIFVRPPRPRSGLSWVSQSGPPFPPPFPPPGPAPGPAPGPGPNPQESGTSQPEHGHPNQPASGNTSRPSSSTYGGRGTPRQSHRSNEGSSHRHSQHIASPRASTHHGMTGTPPHGTSTRVPTGNFTSADSPRSDPNHPPNHHENPGEYFGAPTDETKRYSTDAVVGIHPTGRHQSQTQVHGEQIRRESTQTSATQGRTTILHLEASIRGGSGRPSRRSRAGERPDRSVDGSDARDETDYHRHRNGHILRGLRRYFTFSCWLFGESRDNHSYDRSRSRSRSRRTRRY